MATTPEGWVKKAVKELLEYRGVYYHMPVQNGMGKPSLDFICCVQGQFFAIETKAPGNSMTPRQRRTTAEIERAGGTVFMVNDIPTCRHLWEALRGDGHEVIPRDLRTQRERYFRNAGCKDVDQHAT